MSLFQFAGKAEHVALASKLHSLTITSDLGSEGSSMQASTAATHTKADASHDVSSISPPG